MPLARTTGAGGLIGSYLQRTTPARWTPRPLTRNPRPHRPAGGPALFRKDQPALVLHCAHSVRASRARKTRPSPANSTSKSRNTSPRLAADIPLFFSTDLVFDGKRGNYDENAPVNPLSVYGHTWPKPRRSCFATRATPSSTSLNAGISPTRDRAFNEEMRAARGSGSHLNLFIDEFRNPIPAIATARSVGTR